MDVNDAVVRRLDAARQSVPALTHTGLRLVLVVLVAGPALSKFVTHSRSVAFFDAIGMPFPAAMVVVAGAIEVGAVVLLLVGVRERLAAAALVPVMLVAILHVGPDWKNLSVLLGALALVAIETEYASLCAAVARRGVRSR